MTHKHRRKNGVTWACDCDEIESLAALLREARRDLFNPELIEEVFGPRCSEFDPGCICCRAWLWADDAEAFLDAPDSAPGCQHEWTYDPSMTATNYFCRKCGYFPGPDITAPQPEAVTNGDNP